MSTDEKSPERCALGCADTADIIHREPCSGFWVSCCCRRVLQLRRASPTRRHLIRTIHHLEKALPFKKKKKKNQQSKWDQHKKMPHCRHDGMERPQTRGTWKFCLALLHLSTDGIAARPSGSYGLQEKASTKSGRSNRKEGKKGTFRETTAKWFSAEWTMHKCSTERAKKYLCRLSLPLVPP